jgi:hypothetical protein
MKTKSAAKSGKKRPARPRVVRQKKPPKLRGLLPTPPEVAKYVADTEKRLPMTPEARQRMIDNLNLQYYYSGELLATRYTPKGVEVLAVGLDEVSDLIDRVTPEERQTFTVEQP